MKRISPAMERLVASAALLVAFVVMASVFVPDRSRGVEAIAPEPDVADLDTTDAHQNLIPLGSLETGKYMVNIFGTPGGPRYTVYDAEDGAELGTLMTAEEVGQWFDDLPLPGSDFSMPEPLTLSEPESADWSD